MKNSPQTGSKRLRARFWAALALSTGVLAGCAAQTPPPAPASYLCLPVIVQTPDGAQPGAYCRPMPNGDRR